MSNTGNRPTTSVQRMLYHWQAALLLALVAAAAGLIIGLVADSTAQRIENNRQQQVLDVLASMLPAGSYDNNPATTTMPIVAPGQLQTRDPVTAYLATQQGRPTATVYALTTHDGYNGDIGLLVAIAANGELLAVRLTRHHETPGIGDRIEPSQSDWLRQFAGVSTDLSGYEQRFRQPWTKQFDLITGATITSSAVIDAVARISQYHQQHQRQQPAPALQDPVTP